MWDLNDVIILVFFGKVDKDFGVNIKRIIKWIKFLV